MRNPPWVSRFLGQGQPHSGSPTRPKGVSNKRAAVVSRSIMQKYSGQFELAHESQERGTWQMILAADSPLKRLPTQLNPRQAMFLDAIRFTIEMADFAMERLLSSLTQLSSQSPAESRSFSFAVPRLLDSWSIIDSVHRLRGLFDKLPGLRKRSQSSEFRSFLTLQSKSKPFAMRCNT
jgi:hypothetical protein